MHKGSTDQTMNQVMTPFQQQFGKPCLQSNSFSVGESVFMYRNMKDSPQNSWRISQTVTCAVVVAFIEQSPHKSMRKRSAELGVLHLTMFDHKRDLVVKSFWPVFVIELSDADMRLCHKACALLFEWFLVALSHGKVLFSDECAVYFSSLSWNVFWG